MFSSPRMLEQRMAAQGLAFGQQGHALDPGSFGHQGLQMSRGFGQPSPRASHAARCVHLSHTVPKFLTLAPCMYAI